MVSGEAFCNRDRETSDLVRAMENGEKLFVFSERRYGKTSLVRAARGKLPRQGYACAYVDLWPTDSEATFVTAVAKEIAESMSTSVGKVLVTARKFFGSLSPSVTVDEEGKPNQFKRPGRPRSVFAPKSARMARWLLLKRDHAFTQRALAKASGLDEGFTSRIVRQPEDQRLVSRNAEGAVKVADFDAMLDAWREVYDFSKHDIVRGHIAARSSDEILRRMSEQLKRDKVEHAATGLAGAWLWSGFAGFRLVVYVAELPGEEASRDMGFHQTERGENVWLVRPNDAGVFHGGTVRAGISCAHPVQVYLDLKDRPERSAEAAEVIRRLSDRIMAGQNHNQ